MLTQVVLSVDPLAGCEEAQKERGGAVRTPLRAPFKTEWSVPIPAGIDQSCARARARALWGRPPPAPLPREGGERNSLSATRGAPPLHPAQGGAPGDPRQRGRAPVRPPGAQ